MKVAIMICEKLSHDCTGVGCFEAIQARKGAFKIYEAVELKGFFHCNGCGQYFKGMDYKFEQLKKREINRIHMARCMAVECDDYEILTNKLIEEGFEVIHGSHD